ncbi:MAG: putative toxin-antitoxin system toxin component, PIN family [Elusimicrobiota bacterium]|nr:putative toxin-antitoxin system toxin component, PIN family [Elusimicrobiota bacterium]
MRIVLDANVVISGIFWGGPPQEILKRWLEGKLTLVMSAPILAEYQDVLRRMTGGQGGDIFAKWNHYLTELSEFVEPLPVAVVCRDSGDQKYLEAAAGGRVQALVSGDKDLVVLKVIEGIPILTPTAFLLGHKIQ